MRILLSFCIAFAMAHGSFAQVHSEIPTRNIAFNAGMAKLGTGDMRGLMFGFAYEKSFRPRLSWIGELSTTIHDGSDLMLVTIENQPTQDISYRYTTAAAQLAGKIAYDFIRSPKIDFGVRLGALLRYQTSSLADSRATYFPVVTNYPFPVTVTFHNEPQRTVALGGQMQFFFNYNISRKIVAGASTGLQLDTNGDTMFPPQLLLSIGRRF